jgi:hypothetical protein
MAKTAAQLAAWQTASLEALDLVGSTENARVCQDLLANRSIAGGRASRGSPSASADATTAPC